MKLEVAVPTKFDNPEEQEQATLLKVLMENTHQCANFKLAALKEKGSGELWQDLYPWIHNVCTEFNIKSSIRSMIVIQGAMLHFHQ